MREKTEKDKKLNKLGRIHSKHTTAEFTAEMDVEYSNNGNNFSNYLFNVYITHVSLAKQCLTIPCSSLVCYLH